MSNDKLINVVCLINNELNKSPLIPGDVSMLGRMELLHILDGLIAELKQNN